MKDTNSTGLLFDDDIPTGTLTDKEIKSLVLKGVLISKNFEETGLESASYDVRVGFKGIVGGEGTVKELSESNMLEIQPGQYAGLFRMKNLIYLNIFSEE